MTARATHGLMMNKISPTTMPAIAHFACGVMVTPFSWVSNATVSDTIPCVLNLPVPAEANELLTRSPLALLIGMQLDQQQTFERAFSAPADLVTRLGHEPTAHELADFDPQALVDIFAQRPALHRFPKAMAGRVQEMARIIVDEYDGDTAAMWATADSGGELFKRVSALPGFGKQKAQIFIALLGKQLDVQPPGWREAAGRYGVEGTHMSIADISDEGSLVEVRAYKASVKAAAKAAKG